MAARVQALDTIRGAALVGIAVANVMWFSGYAVTGAAERAALAMPAVDTAVAWLVHLLVDGKFYGLFALLFGAGFALLLEKVGAKQAVVVRRRIVALGCIGLLHASLVWFGDIVSLYAVAAVPLWWVRRFEPGRLLRWAAVCLAAPVVLSGAILLVHVVIGDPAGPSGHGPAVLLPAFSSGTLAQLWSANTTFLVERWILALYSSRLVRLLGLFILGMACARRLPSPSVVVPAWLVAAALASNVGLASLATVPVRPPSTLGLLRDVVYAVAVPSGALVYAGWLWRWGSRGSTAARAFAAAGRLSLTHYVGQSLLMATVFYGVGLGLWGRLGATLAVGFSLVMVAGQVAVSPWWLRNAKRGPLEHLLRFTSSSRPKPSAAGSVADGARTA